MAAKVRFGGYRKRGRKTVASYYTSFLLTVNMIKFFIPEYVCFSQLFKLLFNLSDSFFLE